MTPGSARVALVTGGGRRVGRAIALELAAAGYDVAVHFLRSRAEAQGVVAEIQAMGRKAVAVQGDLARAENAVDIVAATVEKLGGLNVLVNSAAVFHADGSDSLPRSDTQLWRRTFEVNVIAPAALCHAAHRHLRADGRGCIVNLGDIAAQRPWADHLAYCASKAALVNLTRSLARAMAPQVRVNAVSPGIALFPDEFSQDVRERLVKKVPLAREGTPQEVARLVRFLVEEGGYITGQVIAIDGGRGIA